MLQVTFVRRRGRRDHVYVERDDGTTADWAFPSYGDGLPHDLCHLVVEDELALSDGFWGLVDQGVEVGLVDNEATLLKDGTPYAQQPDADLTGLLQAEAAVATLGSPALAVELGASGPASVAHIDDVPVDDDRRASDREAVLTRFGVALPATATPQSERAIRTRLAELAVRWRAIEDRGSIVLPFPSPSP